MWHHYVKFFFSGSAIIYRELTNMSKSLFMQNCINTQAYFIAAQQKPYFFSFFLFSFAAMVNFWVSCALSKPRIIWLQNLIVMVRIQSTWNVNFFVSFFFEMVSFTRTKLMHYFFSVELANTRNDLLIYFLTANDIWWRNASEWTKERIRKSPADRIFKPTIINH